MERTQLFDLMGELKLYGMKAAFDEIMATAGSRLKSGHIRRQECIVALGSAVVALPPLAARA